MARRFRQLLYRVYLGREANHLKPLDGLRGIAALLIVGFHADIWLFFLRRASVAELPLWLHWLFYSGWVGVDIFFVLSGFLIGRILLEQLHRGGIRFRAFYVRRTFRIFPAYYVVLTLSVFLFARLDLFHPLFKRTPAPVLLQRSWANYLYVSNYLYAGTVPNALAWGWSLCIEEHFYLLLPALLVVLFRWTWRSVGLGVLAGLACLPLVARGFAFLKDPVHTVVVYRLYPETHTHFEGLLFGVLIAYGFVHHKARFAHVVSRLGPFPWVAGLACFVAVHVWGGIVTPGFFPVVMQFFVLAVGASLILINGLFVNNRVSRFLAHPVWVPFARLSYGVYLIHVFPIFLIISWWPLGPYKVVGSVASLFAFAGTVLLVSMGCAALLYAVLERPMLHWGARLSQRYAAAAAGVSRDGTKARRAARRRAG